jgi:hypothetical protein
MARIASGQSRLSRGGGTPWDVKQNYYRAGDEERQDLRERKAHEMQYQAVECDNFTERVRNNVSAAPARESASVFGLGRQGCSAGLTSFRRSTNIIATVPTDSRMRILKMSTFGATLAGNIFVITA